MFRTLISTFAVLAPLAAEWDAMEAYRRKKWIGIAQRFPSISGDEQLRIQGQMQEWAKLTPEQRRLAREKYQTMSQLPSEKKQELKQKWEEYSHLPEEEKQKHQQQAVSHSTPKAGRVAAPGTLPPSVSSSFVTPAEAPVAASGSAPLVADPASPPLAAPPPAPAATDADPVPRP